MESIKTFENIINYRFVNHIQDFTLLDKLKNPTKFLFGEKQYQDVNLSIPNMVNFKADLGNDQVVCTIITWYPTTGDNYKVQVGFFESDNFPFINKLLRSYITKLRKQTVNEDTDMMKLLYHGKYQYKIRTKNDEPIYELRRVIKEQFGVEYKDLY
jgi:hypothetical protein